MSPDPHDIGWYSAMMIHCLFTHTNDGCRFLNCMQVYSDQQLHSGVETQESVTSALVMNATESCMQQSHDCKLVMNSVQCRLVSTTSIHDTIQWLESLLRLLYAYFPVQIMATVVQSFDVVSYDILTYQVIYHASDSGASGTRKCPWRPYQYP